MARTKTGSDSELLPTTTSWSTESGEVEEFVQEFTSATAKEDAKAAGRALFCESWVVSPTQAGCYKLTAKIPMYALGGVAPGVNDPNLPLNDAWELQPNAVEKDFLEADIAAFAAITKEDKATIANAIASPTANTTPSLTGAAMTAYLLKQGGTQSTTIYAPVLRRTRLVRRDYTIADALTNVGSVILAGNMRSTEGVPSILLFNLPAGATVTRNDGLVFKYGWLKKYPTVTQVSGGKWQLVQEWAFGLWSVDIYTTI